MATLRQKMAAKKLVENRGKSVGAAMREAGYPPATAKNPKNLTESKGFKKIFGETFTPEYLRKQHVQLANLKTLHEITIDPELEDTDAEKLLNSEGFKLLTIRRWTETTKSGNTYEKAMMIFTAPDGVSKKAALDMAYKILGHFAPIKVQDVDPLEDVPIEDLMKRIDDNKMLLERHKRFKPGKATKPKKP